MRTSKAERERVERERVEKEVADFAELIRATRAAADYLRSGLSSPDPMIRVRCATAILRHANKASEREMLRRLAAFEAQIAAPRLDVGVDFGRL